MARAFVESFTHPKMKGPGGVRHGFFASVDAAPAEGYRAPRLAPAAAGISDAIGPSGPDTRPVTVLTGSYGARILRPLLADHPRDDVAVQEIANSCPTPASTRGAFSTA